MGQSILWHQRQRSRNGWPSTTFCAGVRAYGSGRCRNSKRENSRLRHRGLHWYKMHSWIVLMSWMQFVCNMYRYTIHLSWPSPNVWNVFNIIVTIRKGFFKVSQSQWIWMHDRYVWPRYSVYLSLDIIFMVKH